MNNNPTKAREIDLREILLQGAEVWNRWREDNLDVFIDLRRADLRRAQIIDADLRGAKLSGANLRGAFFINADLRRADLRDAHLREAFLKEADLRGANLRGADFRGADLRGADLRNANLREANLRDAKLRLRKIDFWRVFLWRAENLENVQLKSACFWDEAIYTKEAEWNSEKWSWIPKDEEANQRRLEAIRQDKASNPPNCNELNHNHADLKLSVFWDQIKAFAHFW